MCIQFEVDDIVVAGACSLHPCSYILPLEQPFHLFHTHIQFLSRAKKNEPKSARTHYSHFRNVAIIAYEHHQFRACVAYYRIGIRARCGNDNDIIVTPKLCETSDKTSDNLCITWYAFSITVQQTERTLLLDFEWVCQCVQCYAFMLPPKCMRYVCRSLHPRYSMENILHSNSYTRLNG